MEGIKKHKKILLPNKHGKRNSNPKKLGIEEYGLKWLAWRLEKNFQEAVAEVDKGEVMIMTTALLLKHKN